MSDSFRALTDQGAARLGLAERGSLGVRGSDRVRFLNGMLTNDLAQLSAGQAAYGAQLDRKGHLIADLWVLVLEDEVLLDVADGRALAVLEILDKHLIADDVELDDRSASWSGVSFEGPDAPAASGAPALDPGQVVRAGALVWMAGGGLTEQAVRAFGPRADVDALSAGSGLPELSAEHAEVLRVESFQPRFGVDMGERNFPAEARLASAVSLTKGCYIGQEIVARIHARGAVNRLLVQLATSAPVAVGDEIRDGDRTVGQVTSAVVSPERGPLALGYVKRAQAAPTTALRIGEASATVEGPPLDGA
jgi:aminomethyltransferase